MKFITSEQTTVKLMMWERTLMPDSTMVKDEKTGKTDFIKNGKEVEFTTYTFRDSFGDKLVFMIKSDAYRILEGKFVDITLDVALNDFTKKTQTKLVSCIESADQDPL